MTVTLLQVCVLFYIAGWIMYMALHIKFINSKPFNIPGIEIDNRLFIAITGLFWVFIIPLLIISEYLENKK